MTSRRSNWLGQILVALLACIGNFGCGSGSSGSSTSSQGPLSVSVSPITVIVQEGVAQNFTATVNNDPTNKGVSWTVSCAVTSGCGSLSAVSSPSGAPIIYTAFSNTALNNSATVTVTATSVADTTKSAVATITVPIPPTVSVFPTTGLTHVNSDFVVQAEALSDDITWSLAGCSGGTTVCGGLSTWSCSNGTCYEIYNAPATVPPGGQVTVVATSTVDPTISATSTVLVSPIYFSPTTYSAGSNPVDVVVADFNGDGKLDLAVADNGYSSTDENGGVSILLGNGDGTFQPAQLFSAGNYPSFLSAGDFNGDGKTDLAVSDQGQILSGGNGNLSILLGNGDGTFQPPITVSAGVGPFAQALGDFNGDGKIDIAVIDAGNLSGNNGAIYILLGNGDGTFQPPVLINAGSDVASVPTAIVAQDFNGDGKLDLAVTSTDFSTTSNVSILLGNGDGTFQAPVFYPTGALSPTSLTAGDLRNSGHTDLALTAVGLGCGFISCASSIQLLFGNGDGTFQSSQDVSPTYRVGAYGGAGELSLCNWQGVTDWKGIGLCFPLSLQVADFDGSGRADLVGIGGVQIPAPGGVFVLPGSGDGNFEGILGYGGAFFESLWPFPGGSGAGLALADFNGDGKPDIVTTFQGDAYNPPTITVNLNETVPYGAKTNSKQKRAMTGRR